MSEILRTAAWLAEQDSDTLREILLARRIRVTELGDFFDLAEALLQPASIRAALARVRRGDLQQILAGTLKAERPGRVPLALVDDDGAPWPSVAEAIEAVFAAEADEARIDEVRASTGQPMSQAGDLGERILRTTTAIADFLVTASRGAVRVTARGSVAMTDARRVAELLRTEEADVTTGAALARSAHLWNVLDGSVAPTAVGLRWLECDTSERWMTLAAAWRRDSSPEAREVLSERARHETFASAARRIYPAHAALAAEIEALSAAGTTLGLLDASTLVPTRIGLAVLKGNVDVASKLCRAALPETVTQLYLQNDLSVIAPGPLPAPDDVFLTHIAEIEARGTASTWRLSHESIARALGEGISSEEITEFLQRLSITGVPQALRFMLDDLAARRASIRVQQTASGSIVSGSREALAPLAIDRQLRSLQFDSVADALHSPLTAPVVAWNLAEAGYLSTLIDETGKPVDRGIRRIAATDDPETTHDDEVTGALTRLAEAAARTKTGDQNAEWIGRELELAVREHATVLVDIETPSGALKDRELEPIRVSNGRLRAKDSRAGVERTVPLSSISRVQAVPVLEDPA